MRPLANRFEYPVVLRRDKGDGYVVACRDLPEIVTQGESAPEALAEAADAMDEAFARGAQVDADPRRGGDLRAQGNNEPQAAPSRELDRSRSQFRRALIALLHIETFFLNLGADACDIARGGYDNQRDDCRQTSGDHAHGDEEFEAHVHTSMGGLVRVRWLSVVD